MANPSQVSRIAEIVSNIIRCLSTADVKAIRLADKWLSDLAGDHLFHTVEVNYSKWQDRTSRVAACRIARWARVLKLDLRCGDGSRADTWFRTGSMRQLAQGALKVKTLYIRAELHLAKILETMPFPVAFRSRIDHLVLHHMCWRTPLQVAALLAYFPLVCELSITSFTMVDYDINHIFDFKQVPSLNIRKIRWISGHENQSGSMYRRRIMRQQFARAFARALLPNVTTHLDITDYDPNVVGLLAGTWAPRLNVLNIRMRPSHSIKVGSRWISVAGDLANARFAALREFVYEADDGLDQQDVLGVVAILRAADIYSFRHLSLREFQAGLEPETWDGSVDNLDAALVQFPALESVDIDIARYMADDEDVEDDAEEDEEDGEHYMPSAIMDRVRTNTFLPGVCARLGEEHVLNIVGVNAGVV